MVLGIKAINSDGQNETSSGYPIGAALFLDSKKLDDIFKVFPGWGINPVYLVY
jgi:hypothetical protein